MVQLAFVQLLATTIVSCSHRQAPVKEPQPISEVAWLRHCSWMKVNNPLPKCSDELAF